MLQQLTTELEKDNLDLTYMFNNFIHENDFGNSPFDIRSIDSKYYDIQNIIPDNIRQINFNFKTLHLNIQGLPSHFDKLKILLIQLSLINVELDCIMLCETFINDENAHLFNLNGYTLVYKNRQRKKKGGVAIYIKNSIQYKINKELSTYVEGEFESLFLDLPTEQMIVGEIYRIPGTDPNESLSRYVNILNQIEKINKPTIIGTDQNFDYLKIHSHKITSDLLTSFFEVGMIPTITKPTRITHSTATLIDNIYVKYQRGNIHSGIIYDGMSDHLPVFCFIEKQTKRIIPKDPLQFTSRSINNNAIRLIASGLNNIDWSYIERLEINQAYDEFMKHFKNLIDIYAPEKTITIPARYVMREAWMTKGILASSLNCNKLYRKSLQKPKDHPFHAKYVTYRNLYNKIKNIAKRTYYENLFFDLKSDSKRTWKTIRTLIGKCNDKTTTPASFQHNNETISDSKDIANQFCHFFTNVGSNYASSIPNPAKPFRDYMTENIYSNPLSIFMRPTTPPEIKKIISSLKTKKSAGHDDINSQLIKSVANELSVPLALLVNKSITEGKIPDTLKIAKVVPIFKSKERNIFFKL